MWYKRIVRFWILCILPLSLWGCGAAQNNVADQKPDIEQQLEALAESYRTIYEEAEKTGRLADPEIKEKIIQQLGEEGYAAVDSKSQINMTHYTRVEEFCREAIEKKNT